jgi:hypothetical protein
MFLGSMSCDLFDTLQACMCCCNKSDHHIIITMVVILRKINNLDTTTMQATNRQSKDLWFYSLYTKQRSLVLFSLHKSLRKASCPDQHPFRSST